MREPEYSFRFVYRALRPRNSATASWKPGALSMLATCAAFGDHGEARAGHGVGHALHHVGRRAGILGADHEQGRDRDTSEVLQVIELFERRGGALVARDRRRQDHLLDARHDLRVLLAEGRREPALDRGPEDALHARPIDQSDALVPALHVGLGGVGAGVAADELLDPPGMLEGEAEAGHAAERQAHEGCLVDAMTVHEGDHVLDQKVERIGAVGRVAEAVAARVVAQHPVARRERRDLRIPHGVVRGDAGRQDEPGGIASFGRLDAREQAAALDRNAAHSAASGFAVDLLRARLTSGITFSAMRIMERRPRSRSSQSLPA